MPSLEGHNKLVCESLQERWNVSNYVNESLISDFLDGFDDGIDNHTVNTSSTCAIDFDGSVCWNETAAGSIAVEQCPFTICDGCNSPDIYVTRVCLSTGVWAAKNDWSGCLRILKTRPDCFSMGCHKCPDFFKDLVIGTSLFLSTFSIILLLISLVIFLSFRCLRCRRLTIHVNLACAFILRFFFFAVWTMAQIRHAFIQCDSRRHIGVYRHDWEPVCKALLWLLMYTQVASIMWMFVEGMYLMSRFTVLALRRSEGPIWGYLLVGWGSPAVLTGIWAVVHDTNAQPGSFCWMPYTKGWELWILVLVMGAAITLNLIFLLVVVILLVQKLQAANSAESQKIWKTAKATLLLIPLLGISNVPLFWEPSNPSNFYMYISTVLQNSQGIFIAILYCFCNVEVQNALRRQCSKWGVGWKNISMIDTDFPMTTRNSIMPRTSKTEETGFCERSLPVLPHHDTNEPEGSKYRLHSTPENLFSPATDDVQAPTPSTPLNTPVFDDHSTRQTPRQPDSSSSNIRRPYGNNRKNQLRQLQNDCNARRQPISSAGHTDSPSSFDSLDDAGDFSTFPFVDDAPCNSDLMSERDLPMATVEEELAGSQYPLVRDSNGSLEAACRKLLKASAKDI